MSGKKRKDSGWKDWNYEGSKVWRKKSRNPRGVKFVWKEDWSWFKHTCVNRVDSTKNKTKLLKPVTDKDFISYKVVWGWGKSIKIKDLNKKHLVEEIYHKYIKGLEEKNSNDIGFVCEYWTSDFDRKWTDYHSFGDARSVLMKELIRVSRFYDDWMLLSVEIRQKLNAEDVKVVEVKKAVKPVPKKWRRPSGRGVAVYMYINDFRSFHRVKETLLKRRKKVFKDLESCYLNPRGNWYDKDADLIKKLTLKVVGIYYINRLGLRLKVIDKSVIRTRSRINRKIYRYCADRNRFR